MKKVLSKDILIIIFVNLFLANIYPHGLFIAVYFATPFLFEESGTLTQKMMFTFALFLPVVRLFWLPILYARMEKYSNNELVQKFISNLKNNTKFRWKTLFIVELPWICYYIYLIMYKIISGLSTYARYDSTGFLNTINWNLYWYSLNSYLSQILFVALILIVFFNMSGSYLVLFLWWKIRGELK